MTQKGIKSAELRRLFSAIFGYSWESEFNAMMKWNGSKAGREGISFESWEKGVQEAFEDIENKLKTKGCSEGEGICGVSAKPWYRS